eukprot:scaffold67790_cov24-Tisochrysis_lutea.AAC.3
MRAPIRVREPQVAHRGPVLWVQGAGLQPLRRRLDLIVHPLAHGLHFVGAYPVACKLPVLVPRPRHVHRLVWQLNISPELSQRRPKAFRICTSPSLVPRLGGCREQVAPCPVVLAGLFHGGAVAMVEASMRLLKSSGAAQHERDMGAE